MPRPARAGSHRASDQIAVIKSVFPKLAAPSCYGLGVVVRSVRRLGAEGEVTEARLAQLSRRPGQRPTASLLDSADSVAIARLVSGLAHADRLRIARAMACGAVTHHDLQKAVNIKTGPLYHHIRALERADVVIIRGRNEYSLTTGGRMMLLSATAIAAAASAGKPDWQPTQLRINGNSRKRRGRRGQAVQKRSRKQASVIGLVGPERTPKSKVP